MLPSQAPPFHQQGPYSRYTDALTPTGLWVNRVTYRKLKNVNSTMLNGLV